MITYNRISIWAAGNPQGLQNTKTKLVSVRSSQQCDSFLIKPPFLLHSRRTEPFTAVQCVTVVYLFLIIRRCRLFRSTGEHTPSQRPINTDASPLKRRDGAHLIFISRRRGLRRHGTSLLRGERKHSCQNRTLWDGGPLGNMVC